MLKQLDEFAAKKQQKEESHPEPALKSAVASKPMEGIIFLLNISTTQKVSAEYFPKLAKRLRILLNKKNPSKSSSQPYQESESNAKSQRRKSLAAYLTD